MSFYPDSDWWRCIFEHLNDRLAEYNKQNVFGNGDGYSGAHWLMSQEWFDEVKAAYQQGLYTGQWLEMDATDDISYEARIYGLPVSISVAGNGNDIPVLVRFTGGNIAV